MPVRSSFSPRSLSGAMLQFLGQGITPGKLALTLALGVTLSCFPVFGATTLLCTLVAFALRLNLPAIQAGNYLAMPLQLVLLVPFLRLGERLFRAPRMPLVPAHLLTLLRSSPDQTMRLLLAAQWHAIAAWMLLAPGMVLLLTAIFKPLLKGLIRRVGAAKGRRTSLTEGGLSGELLDAKPVRVSAP